MPAWTVRGLVIVLLLATAAQAIRAQDDAGLFVDVVRPAADVSTAEPTVVRRRWVSVNFTQVRDTAAGAPAAAAPGQTLTLNLFPDARFVAVLDRLEVTATGYVWIGRVPGLEPGAVTLAVTNGVMAGSVVTPTGTYSIGYVGDGVHSVQELNPAAFPAELPPIPAPVAAADPGAPVVATDDGSLIDVLVVYTPAARTARGGTSAIEALIDLGIAETNQAYANTGAIQRVRLVNKQEVSYTEAASMETDLSRLQNPSDGFMDSVHALREAYGADLVHLIANAPSFCGIAYLLTSVSTSFASLAFGVTHHTCVSPNYTFAHEMGHNMGLHHDIYMTGSETGAFAYSRGYVNQAAFPASQPSSKRWRDIMAYDNQCAAAGFSCSRFQYFANPNLSVGGDPMGNASTADGRRSLDETRVTVANFRESITTPSVSVSVNDVRMTEGHSGTRSLTFTVSLSATSSSSVTASYATQDITASGSDYVGTSGTVSISAGSTSQPVSITLNGDTVAEPSETFSLNLSNPSGATLADSQGIGTIINDDFTDLSLSGVVIKAVHVSELRTAIDEVRSARGLSAFSFTDGTLTAQSTVIRAVHITDMRSALAQAYAAAGQTAPTYSDPSLSPGNTVRAVHITEIRTAVLNLQ